MESLAMLNEHITKLLKEDCIYTKRVTEVSNMEFDLDNESDIENLIDLLENYEESLKQARYILLRERAKERSLVRCLECLYLHKEEQNKNYYFCLKAREFIEHGIDENVSCKGYEPLFKEQNNP